MPRTSKRTVKEKKTYSWLLLLESRHARPPEKEPTSTSERGRPRLNVATYQTSVTLSKGDREAIDYWQEQLSTLIKRKVSMGETMGFLARICQERMAMMTEQGFSPQSLEEMVQVFVAGAGEE